MERIRKILSFILIILLAYSCGSNGSLKKSKGELVGVKGKKYYPEKPFGMVLVPGGSFIMGKSDDDIAGIQDAPQKTVTVRSFYMDETEITNSEYRQFVNWVRDSIIRTALAERAKELMDIGPVDNTGENEGGIIQNYAYLGSDEEKTPYQKFDSIYGNSESQRLNWDEELIFNRADYPDDMDYIEVIESFFINEKETLNKVRSWNTKLFVYEYVENNMDEYFTQRRILVKDLIEDLAENENIVLSPGEVDDELLNIEYGFKKSTFMKPEVHQVYPDTAVWYNDFEYSYNDPMHNDYFSHEAYSDYPVVGVNWHQAKAFCAWRTFTKNSYQKTKKKKSLVPQFRLPTEAEWEFAARGGLQGAMYPWGGPYTKNDRGCFMANFKPMRGDYAVDQALYTVEANAYDPNGYNLYNMAGNVSEWVDTSYESEAYEFTSTMNPNINVRQNNKKVIRGGSWKDVKYFLQVSSRDYEYSTNATSYIGFRTVHDYLGADMTANAMTNNAIKKQNNKRSTLR